MPAVPAVPDVPRVPHVPPVPPVPEGFESLSEAITRLVEVFDDALGDDLSQPATLLLFNIDEGGVDLGIKQLPPGAHPLDGLLGFVVPDDAYAMGVVSHGWGSTDAHAGTDPARGTVRLRASKARDRRRVRTFMVVARDGSTVSGVRIDGEPLRWLDPPEGAVPDAIRRALGLATTPPGFPAAELSAARWLDDLLSLQPQPGRRWLTIEDVVATRPAPYLSWEDARWAVVRDEVRMPGVTATLAAWMDDGIFARTVVLAHPELGDLLGRVSLVVDSKALTEIRRTLADWGVQPMAA